MASPCITFITVLVLKQECYSVFYIAMAGPDGILPSISRKNPERDFELMKQIGSGTYGEVYKVSCQYIRRVV